MYLTFLAAFCQSNCAVIGTSGCTTCKSGFITEPECCQCEPGRTEVNGVCSKYNNVIYIIAIILFDCPIRWISQPL
jgi:hypothetical protein